MTTCRVFIAAAALLYATASRAQSDTITSDKVITNARMAAIGSADILDTYLTPIKYSGLGMRIGYERLQAMKFSPFKWVSQMDAGVEYQKVQNPVGNHTMHSLIVEYTWGMMHRWYMDCVPGLQLMAGGGTRFR